MQIMALLFRCEWSFGPVFLERGCLIGQQRLNMELT